jgi:hypothetical protein
LFDPASGGGAPGDASVIGTIGTLPASIPCSGTIGGLVDGGAMLGGPSFGLLLLSLVPVSVGCGAPNARGGSPPPGSCVEHAVKKMNVNATAVRPARAPGTTSFDAVMGRVHTQALHLWAVFRSR